MRVTSDRLISVNTDFELNPQSKETSAGHIKNHQIILITNESHPNTSKRKRVGKIFQIQLAP